MLRIVDSHGALSFAGAAYRVGNAFRGRQVAVAIVGNNVQLAVEGAIIRVHPIRHDRTKEHGAFANPGGRPHRMNAAGTPR